MADVTDLNEYRLRRIGDEMEQWDVEDWQEVFADLPDPDQIAADHIDPQIIRVKVDLPDANQQVSMGWTGWGYLVSNFVIGLCMGLITLAALGVL